MSNVRRAFLLAFVVLAACEAAHAGAILEDNSEQTFSVGANPTLSVRNTDGRVYVYGSEDNEIKVKVYKRAFTKERLDQIAPKITLEGDAMTIDTYYPPIRAGLFEDRSGTVEYTVLVPQNCAVSKVELAQGEIQIEGLRGPGGVDLHLTNGRITMRSCFTPMRISLGSGGIDVIYNWWEEDPFSLAADVGKGDVKLHLPPTAALQVDATTQSGHVRNHLLEDAERGEDVQTLQTTIGTGSEIEFKLRAADGNIEIVKAY
jgi:hypothetical protein